MRSRPVLLLALILTVLAVACVPAGAAQAPRVGQWIGEGPHDLRLSFTVHEGPAGRRYIGQEVTICNDAKIGDEGFENIGLVNSSPAWPIDAQGRIRNQRGRDVLHKRSPMQGRLGARTGVLRRYPVIVSSPSHDRCSAGGWDPRRVFGPVRVRWAGPQKVPSGRYETTGDLGTKISFWVLGGALVTGVVPDVRVPRVPPLPFFGPVCLAASNIVSDAWVEGDGTFASHPTLEPLQLIGRFDGATVTGTYRFNTDEGDPACADGPFSFSGRLVEPQAPPTSDGIKLDPATGQAPPTTPGPCPNPQTVRADPVEAISCFGDRRRLKVSTSTVRVNGIDVVPIRRAEIRLDPATAHLTARGAVEVHVPVGPYGTRNTVRVWRGRGLDWRLRGVRSFKLRSSGRNPDLGSLPAFGEQVVGGLPLKGKAEFTFEPGSARGKLNVELPEAVRGVGGDVAVKTTNAEGLLVDEAKLTSPSARLGPFDLKSFSAGMSRASDRAIHWDGSATIEIQGDRGVTKEKDLETLEVKIEIGFGTGDGYFKLAGNVDGINKQVYRGIFWQRFGIAGQRKPLKFTGSVGFSAGPQVDIKDVGKLEAVSLDGSYELEPGDPLCYQTTTTGKLLTAEILKSRGKMCSNGLLEGQFDLRTSPVPIASLEGSLTGWVFRDQAFNLEGAATVRLANLPAARADAVASNTGLAACLRSGPSVGFGYRWRDRRFDLMSRSCGIGPWRAAKPKARAAQAAPAAEFRVRRGRRTAAFSAVGTTAAPRLTLTGPSRVTAEPAARLDERVLALQDPDTGTSYIAIERPSPGRWRLEADGPVGALRSAVPRARVRVAARVTRARRLHYRIRHGAGARVRFVEMGRGIRHVLGTARGRRGSMRIRPQRGGPPRRRIVAVVERDGVPSSSGRVARFRVR